ncbi:hypothetical protein BRADI_1g15785v3 [Brachypodium distachyon]|uniref:Reverse transcriptase zinc-binding domain-containing protein n=1 Tax=Brachypodium distachyon TaxID=15368 RepID=A0A2K2DJP5_BRADI|nr:hypothetical protein BRADI_1g15785v3 [Brachypodium distachyon]
MLDKKNSHLQALHCVLCSMGIKETIDHLFFECPFALTCWRYICPNFIPHQSVHDSFAAIKEELKSPFHMEVSVLVTWSIWRTRNNYIFNQIQPSFYRCKMIFKEELILISFPIFLTWLTACAYYNIINKLQ